VDKSATVGLYDRFARCRSLLYWEPSGSFATDKQSIGSMNAAVFFGKWRSGSARIDRGSYQEGTERSTAQAKPAPGVTNLTDSID
jgi:hypothetical protein